MRARASVVFARVTIWLVLSGLVGSLVWAGSIYFTLYHKRQAALEEEFGYLERMALALPEDSRIDQILEAEFVKLLKRHPEVHYVALGEEKGGLILLAAGVGKTIPSDWHQRPFPGFLAVPLWHHRIDYSFVHRGQGYVLALMVDPQWSRADVGAWLGPLITLAVAFYIGVVGLLTLLYTSRPRASAVTPRSEQGEEQRTEEVPLPAREGEKSQGPVREQQSSKRLFDSAGLVWSDILPIRLRSELDRAASESHDLTLVLFRIEGPSGWEPLFLEEVTELTPYRDLVFRYPGGCAVILPRITFERAFERVKSLCHRLGGRLAKWSVRAGLSSRAGRLLEPDVILDEAQQALKKTGSHQDQVVGFKADPDRYRAYLKQLEETP